MRSIKIICDVEHNTRILWGNDRLGGFTKIFTNRSKRLGMHHGSLWNVPKRTDTRRRHNNTFRTTSCCGGIKSTCVTEEAEGWNSATKIKQPRKPTKSGKRKR